MSFRLRRVDFAALPGWRSDDALQPLQALRHCARHVGQGGRYRSGSLGLHVDDFAPAFAALAQDGAADTPSARGFFEHHFRPFAIEPDTGSAGFVTGYYEPEVEVAAAPDERFRFPFYRRPHDLVDIDADSAPHLNAKGHAYARQCDGGLAPYPDRREIENGFLDGRGLEIAWAADRVDVFFAHIQGSARLIHRDGSVRRITFAAKSGHPFTAIGRILIERGELPAAQVTMASIRRWLADHPASVDELLWCNRSFIFFRESNEIGLGDGPIGAAKVALTPGRSLAVDRSIHTFSTPFYIHAPGLDHLEGGPFRRLMIAQDTGSAIVGPARGDIFTGSGRAAGDGAGSVKHAADFHVLLPLPAVDRVAG